MLHGVAALVGGNGRRRDARRVVDAVAQVDGHRLGVEVVGQVSRHVRHLDVVDVVLAQHLLGDLGAREPAGELNLRIFLEHRLEPCLDDVAGDADGDDEQKHARRSGGEVCALLGARIEQGDKWL